MKHRHDHLPAIAAAALSLVLYAVTLRGTYIYDDYPVVVEDARVANPSLWPKFWTQQYLVDGADNLYRPLISMSYAIQWWLHGDRPWAFHVVNWLLAAGCAAAVAELGRRLAGRPPAWIAGLLFASHPIHVEAVAGIVGRAELACLLATFSGLILFLRRPLSAGRVCAILACLVLAILSKEQGLLFPLLLVALIPVRRSQLAATALPDPALTSERPAGKWLAVGILYLQAGYLIFRESILKFGWDRNLMAWPDNPLIRSVGVDRWLMPFVLLGRYTTLLVAPSRLSIDYGASVIGSTVRYQEPYLYVGLAVTVCWVVCFALAIRRKAWPAAFALFGLAVSYGLVSNLPVLIGTIFGERLMFMPSAFLAILMGIAVSCALRSEIGASARFRRRLAIGGAVGVLVVLGAIRTIGYAVQWNDQRTFYETSLAAQPGSVRLHALVYLGHKQRGDWAAARAIGEDCRQETPQWWESWTMCAEPEMHLGRLGQAKALIDQAFKVCPHNALIGWSEMIDDKIAAATQPASRPAP